MRNIWYYTYPVGQIGIVEENGFISNLFFDNDTDSEGFELLETLLIKKAATQLEEYFYGELTEFDLPLCLLHGTVFQQSVWKALQTISAGKTRSYKEIAIQIGNPKAARAVGRANNRNPIPIIVPCHRVIGARGDLTGYAGGIAIKRYLLDLEKSKNSK